ncbi:MAG TPA: ChbG/HpnK family deacetylase [Candidatus Acidoferrales bacterium]|nr:ChbG/HpnK family deacetylase [Candidatus Acidoferrales bacterium]
MKQLIINADDFGFTRGVNEGIIRAHRDGILTSTTLMANGPAFEDAVERAKANPKLGVGCHLVLTGGLAVAPAEEIPTLAERDGRLPRSLAALVWRVSSGMVRTMEIERELRAQIEKIRGAGIEPTHLDTHKHTHVHPRIMGALGRVARECGITRVRNPVENLRDSWRTTRGGAPGSSSQLPGAAAVRAVAPLFRAISRKYELHSPDHFLGLAMTGRLGTAALCRLIDTVPDGRTEIMVHPGVLDGELAATGSRLRMERQVELDGLLAPETRRAIVERGIQLISYRELN